MIRGRLLFASIHGYLDPSSGAALATRELLELLAARGWDCRALTCGILDYQRETTVDELLSILELEGAGRRLNAELGAARPRRWSTSRSMASASRSCPRPPAGPSTRPTRGRTRRSSTWPGRCCDGSGPTWC